MQNIQNLPPINQLDSHLVAPVVRNCGQQKCTSNEGLELELNPKRTRQ